MPFAGSALPRLVLRKFWCQFGRRVEARGRLSSRTLAGWNCTPEATADHVVKPRLENREARAGCVSEVAPARRPSLVQTNGAFLPVLDQAPAALAQLPQNASIAEASRLPGRQAVPQEQLQQSTRVPPARVGTADARGTSEDAVAVLPSTTLKTWSARSFGAGQPSRRL